MGENLADQKLEVYALHNSNFINVISFTLSLIPITKCSWRPFLALLLWAANLWQLRQWFWTFDDKAIHLLVSLPQINALWDLEEDKEGLSLAFEGELPEARVPSWICFFHNLHCGFMSIRKVLSVQLTKSAFVVIAHKPIAFWHSFLSIWITLFKQNMILDKQ